MFLAMKEYVSWYRQWEFLRGILDLRNIAPIIAKVTENKASDDDLATVHLASIPRDMPDELRRSFASHIDRKSTRLSSSHLGISYAVFCLKKKHICTPSHQT